MQEGGKGRGAKAGRLERLVKDEGRRGPGINSKMAESEPSLRPLGVVRIQTGHGTDETPRFPLKMLFQVGHDALKLPHPRSPRPLACSTKPRRINLQLQARGKWGTRVSPRPNKRPKGSKVGPTADSRPPWATHERGIGRDGPTSGRKPSARAQKVVPTGA
jgi:hypothetical protein